MNKKLTVVAAACIILAGAATPYGIGMLFKSRLQPLIDFVNEANPNTKITIIESSVHWLSSDLTYTFSTLHIDRPETPSNKPSNDQTLKPIPQKKWTPIITFKTKISHGPIVYDVAKKSWGFAFIASEVTNYQIADKDTAKILEPVKFKSSMLWTFSGNLTSLFSISPFSIDAENKINVNYDGLTCTDHYLLPIWGKLAKLNTYDINCDSKMLKISSKDPASGFQFTVSPFNLTWLLDRSNDFAIWTNSFKLSSEGIASESIKSPKPFKIGKFTLTDQSKVNGANYKDDQDFNVQQLLIPSDIIPEINSISWKTNVADFKAEGVKFIYDFLDKAKQEDSGQGNPLQTVNSELFLKELLPKLLKTSSHFGSAFLLTTPNGQINSDLKLSWPKLQGTMTSESIISTTQVSGKLTASVDLVNKIVDGYADFIAPTTSAYSKPSSSPSTPVTLTESTANTAAKVTGETSSTMDFSQLVADNLKAGTLNYTVSMQLLETYSQQKPVAAFDEVIQKNNIDATVATSLRQSYEKSIASATQAMPNPAMPTAATAVTLPAPDNKASLKQQIQDWVRDGYILKNEQNQYVLILKGSEVEGFTLNGKQLSAPKKP